MTIEKQAIDWLITTTLDELRLEFDELNRLHGILQEKADENNFSQSFFRAMLDDIEKRHKRIESKINHLWQESKRKGSL
jgi:ABC-type phosphate transport system auxiliary subunit